MEQVKPALRARRAAHKAARRLTFVTVMQAADLRSGNHSPIARGIMARGSGDSLPGEIKPADARRLSAHAVLQWRSPYQPAAQEGSENLY